MRKPARSRPGPKLAEQLAARIEDRVEREGLGPGCALGTEHELMARYGISRETLRKAVRQLELHGVASMRRGGGGGGGGLVVDAAASDTVVRAIATHLEFSSISWSEIIEARALIDLQAVELATGHIDDAGIARLKALAITLDRETTDVREIAQRHLALPATIADIGGNAVVKLFTEALNRWIVDILPSNLGSNATIQRESTRANRVLKDLIEAVAARDVAAARTAALAFAELSQRTTDVLERHRPGFAAEEWLQHASSLGNGHDKLPQRLAVALAREIAAFGEPEERFGDEAGLMARLGVSRSVLREALRLLELHGILRPRRGRGGGLMIDQPDPHYTIEAAKRYLRRAHLSPGDYLAVRDALERGAVDLAISHATDIDLAQLHRLGDVIRDAPDDEVVTHAIRWHAKLAIIGGNRPLSLLLNILFALTEEPHATIPREVGDQLRDRQDRLDSAMLERDRAAAHSILSEHVDWLRDVLDTGLGSLSAESTRPQPPTAP